jgi:hypothetical protein
LLANTTTLGSKENALKSEVGQLQKPTNMTKLTFLAVSIRPKPVSMLFKMIKYESGQSFLALPPLKLLVL